MELLGQLAAAVGDRYRVERELGQGGMAVVFLAEDLKHHRRVAIKLLKPELSAVLGSERFLREIAIAATLQHPHILPLYDSGQAGGLFYYVMPFVEGESLRQRLAREQQLPARRRIPDHPRGRQRPAVRPRARRHPSGYQAGEHHAVRRPGRGRRLRHRPGPGRRRRGAAHAERHGRRHAAVHEPGAVRRGDHGRPHRSVQPGVHPVRDADRPAAVQRTLRPRGHRAPLGRPRAQPAGRAPDRAPGGRGGDHAGDGEGAGRPL